VKERVVKIDLPLIDRGWCNIINSFLFLLRHRPNIITNSLPDCSCGCNKISTCSLCALQERDSLDGLGYLLYLLFHLRLAFFNYILKNICLIFWGILPSNVFWGRSWIVVVKLSTRKLFWQISHWFVQFHFIVWWIRCGLIGRNGIRGINLGFTVWVLLFLFVCL
jgi:hypothetical protein